MRRLNKAAALVLILIMVLSMGTFAFAEGEPQSQAVKTGFYVKDAVNGNKFIDLYTFLNNKKTYSKLINNAGLDNVLFVHQSGKGAALKEILTGKELKELKEENFEESYVDAATNTPIKPVLGLNLLKVLGENGKLIAVFEGVPAEGEPAVNNFTITKSVNGAEDAKIEITETDLVWNLGTRRATLTIPEVKPTEEDQTVVYTITYKEQEAKTVEIFVKGTTEYVFDVQLDKTEYKVDEDITVSGTVLKGEVGLAGIDITLKLGNENIISVEQIKTNEKGEFTHTFQVPAGTEAGTYTLTVQANIGDKDVLRKELKLNIVDVIPEAVIQELASRITELYKNVAEEDKEAIRQARLNIKTLEDSAWDGLLTDEVIAKFDDEKAAKEKIGAAIKDLSELYYSEDTTELEARLKTLAEKHLPTYRTIFGNEESVEELYALFNAILDNVPNAITATQGNELVEASDAELIGKIEGIVKTTIDYTLEQEAYSKYKGRLSSVGLSVDNLIDVKSSIANEIDADGKAQIALINAYARAKAVVDGPTTVKVGENANYTLTVLGREATTLANWSSSNPEVATISDDEKAVLIPVAAGTTTITVYRGENPANWIAKFDVTVEEAEEAPKSSACEITATTIGTLEGTVIKEVPLETTVQELKGALTLSDKATVEIGTLVEDNFAKADDTAVVTAEMIIRVTAEDGTTKDYTIVIAN